MSYFLNTLMSYTFFFFKPFYLQWCTELYKSIWIKLLNKTPNNTYKKKTNRFFIQDLWFSRILEVNILFYQLLANVSFDDNGEDSAGIIPGGAGMGIGFMISSMSNFGITLRSWLCPWWLKSVWCWCCCVGSFALDGVACGKDFGSCDLDGSALRAFHLSFNAFKAIARLRSLSCWSDGDIDIVKLLRSLELERLSGIIGWCLTSPMFKLNL